jgi:glucokinase
MPKLSIAWASIPRGANRVILAGDIGGTKTALALFEPTEVGPVLVRDAVLRSKEFLAFESAVAEFLSADSSGPIDAASFGIAGPVVEGRVTTTNLPWTIDERALEKAIPTRRVRLINDLEATGYGLASLAPESLVTLQQGNVRAGNVALIAAGTGLGEALLIWDGEQHRVVASEGGHADFAPRTDLEVDLLRFLSREFGHVSYERILSGPGLFNVYRFLRDTGRAQEPPWLAAKLAAARDPTEIIGPVAIEGCDPLCAMALDLFIGIYGAEAGNLGLKAVSMGGVYVAGGIAPRYRARFAEGDFIEAFRAKGRFRPLMETIPVYLVLEQRAAMLGAARVAASLVQRFDCSL